MLAVPAAATNSWVGWTETSTGGLRVNWPPPVPTDAAQLDGPIGNVRLKKFIPTVEAGALMRWQVPAPANSTLSGKKVPVAFTVQAPVKRISALAGALVTARAGTRTRRRPRT